MLWITEESNAPPQETSALPWVSQTSKAAALAPRMASELVECWLDALWLSQLDFQHAVFPHQIYAPTGPSDLRALPSQECMMHTHAELREVAEGDIDVDVPARAVTASEQGDGREALCVPGRWGGKLSGR